MTNRQTSSDKN